MDGEFYACATNITTLISSTYCYQNYYFENIRKKKRKLKKIYFKNEYVLFEVNTETYPKIKFLQQLGLLALIKRLIN